MIVSVTPSLRYADEAEIEDLHAAVGEEKDVLRLQVATDDRFRMRGRQPFGQRNGNLHRFGPGDRGTPESLAKRLSVEQLRDRVGDASIRPEIVDGKDVRMRQGGDRLGFALEPLERIAVLRQMVGQHLEGHVAIEPRVARAIDLAHAPGAKQRRDFVGAEPAANGKRHVRRSPWFVHSSGRVDWGGCGCYSDSL